MKEEWRTIAEAPEYEVSNAGRVRRAVARHYFPAGKLMALTECSVGGYLKVGLWVDGKTRTRLVHRLVCAAFKGPPPSRLHEAAHSDGNPKNNRAENISWKTPTENGADKIAHGTCSRLAGEKHPRAKLSEEAVRIIRATPRYNGVLPDLARRFGVAENTIMALRTRGSGKWRTSDHPQPPATSAS